MDIKNILRELEKEPQGTFLNVAKFNDRNVGACSVTGISPVWEMHPDTDELFYIIAGEVSFTLLEDTGEKNYQAGAGSVFVVPKGIWHKPGAPDGATFLYFTPGQSLHSDADDPRSSQE